MALLKLCGCGKPIPAQEQRCKQCQSKRKDRHKLYDKNVRDKESAKFYNSKGWKLLREMALNRDLGLCQHCYKGNKITMADMVDHIVPVKVNWERRLDINNLQSLCNRCHSVKTTEDKKNYGKW